MNERRESFQSQRLRDRPAVAAEASGKAAFALLNARVPPTGLRTRERRGLSDAPKGCSIAHSLMGWRGASRPTAEDYWTRREACSIARRRCTERGRRPHHFNECRRVTDGRHAASAKHKRTIALEAASCLRAAPRPR